MTAYLILENGITFQGKFFGKPANVTGNVVFATGMNGHMETITDPSNLGQILVQTFPLIGNSGVISADLESKTIHASAYIVKYLCQEPSNFRSEGDLDTFFVSKGVTGVEGIDTRALTKIIRAHGTIRGKITTQPPTQADQDEAMAFTLTNATAAVSAKEKSVHGSGTQRVALLDLGVRQSTINALVAKGCEVHVFPHNATAAEIMAVHPHGVVLSTGPGSPLDPSNAPVIDTIKALTNIPIFAIGMGHLLLAMANGLEVAKMNQCHRGANQAVRDCNTGKLYITSQNHGYHVIASNPSFVNVNDNTCEGMDYGLTYSVQFRPDEGPKDTMFLFDNFVERMKAHAAR